MDDIPLLTTLIRRLHLVIRRRIHADLLAAGHDRLAPAHMYVFQNPGADGARPTELARRSNMTKQAMNHLLAGLERNGYLERIPSTVDRRGTIIRLTERGREVERLMQESSATLEIEWAAAVEDGAVEQLRALLIDIEAAVARGVGDRRIQPA
jgi:DNA-binding MarR family transcriptional regulator